MNGTHRVRDGQPREDARRMRKGNLSGVLAAFNNLANPTLRMLGHKNIARHGRAEPSPGVRLGRARKRQRPRGSRRDRYQL